MPASQKPPYRMTSRVGRRRGSEDHVFGARADGDSPGKEIGQPRRVMGNGIHRNVCHELEVRKVCDSVGRGEKSPTRCVPDPGPFVSAQSGYRNETASLDEMRDRPYTGEGPVWPWGSNDGLDIGRMKYVDARVICLCYM